MRRYLVLGLVILGAAVGYGVTLTQSTLYASASTLMIVPQRVPESYVSSGVTTDLEARLPIIAQQIMTRTRLERIVQDLGLYQDERLAGESMEDIVRRMREQHIRLRPSIGSSFVVSYQNKDPRVAMKVTERLASFLIEENLRDREMLAENTNQFMDSQLDETRRRLDEKHARLVEARRQGRVPRSMELDIEVLEARYRELSAMSAQAKVAADLERRHIGEQFKVIDAARVPQRPVAQGRHKSAAIGAAIGLIAGLGIAFRRPRG